MKAIAAVLVLTLALIGCGGGASNADPQVEGVRVVSADAAKDLIASGEVTVIDVRTPQEFAEGHVKGARNIDVEAADFETRIEALDPADSYLVYCHSGRRSAIAAEAMHQAGFTDIADAGAFAGLTAVGVPTG